MNKFNYLKIVWAVGFLAFAFISCYATTESLHLLQPSLPLAFCWVVTVGFFIVASLGTKMIVDSLNTGIYLEYRGARLAGGIFLTVVFWLLFSLPTNTHTFFYREVIGDVVSTDIDNTREYLGQIKDNTNNKDQVILKINKLQTDVELLLSELENEIKNEANPGHGPKAKAILEKFAKLFGVAEVAPLSSKGTSEQDRKLLCTQYRRKIYAMAQGKAASMEKNILTPNAQNIKDVEEADRRLSQLNDNISAGDFDLSKPENITGPDGACDRLLKGYTQIKTNSDFVNFRSSADEAKYTADNPVTEASRMVSVISVWKDYFDGKFAGRAFFTWILLSVLVDIAAFIFFYLVTK